MSIGPMSEIKVEKIPELPVIVTFEKYAGPRNHKAMVSVFVNEIVAVEQLTLHVDNENNPDGPPDEINVCQIFFKNRSYAVVLDSYEVVMDKWVQGLKLSQHCGDSVAKQKYGSIVIGEDALFNVYIKDKFIEDE